MSTIPFTERRRSPRVAMLPDEVMHVGLKHRVQLLDISLTGALIACEQKLPVGTRGQFTAGLAAVPFKAEVVLGRVHPRPAPLKGQTSMGAAFAAMDERSRTHLESFLMRARE